MVQVPLANGKGVAVVDDEDGPRVAEHRWYRHEVKGKVYARSSTAGYLHRFITGLHKGDGIEVDHRDGDGLNNRTYNLWICTHAENQQNRRRQGGVKTSSYRGVCWWKTRGCWAARVKVGGRQYHLGYFDDEDEAGAAAAAGRERLMTHSLT